MKNGTLVTRGQVGREYATRVSALKKLGKQSKRDMLDKVFGAKVREVATCADDREGHECAGPFQAAHMWSRRYNGTRWEARNVFCLCARAHVYYDSNPIQKDDFMLRKWGEEQYKELRMMALNGRAPREHELDEMLKAYGVSV